MPNSPRKTLVFTTLALNQTRFFAAVAQHLTTKGFDVACICFHERSVDYCRANGIKAFNIYNRSRKSSGTGDLSRYNLTNSNLWISHEKVAFNLHQSKNLHDKLGRYLLAVESILAELRQGGHSELTLIQEFGGFIALVSAFFAARRQGIDNIFIEPSFFRGRVLFVRNSFDALQITDPDDDAVSGPVKEYIDQTVGNQSIVIPQKDSHHYRKVTQKLTDAYHLRRLYEKLLDKHLFNKKEEFNHIGYHVARHLQMLVNNLRLNRYYRSLPRNEPFIYYPLHVPNDAALTIRSPEYLDQYSLLDYVARMIPGGYKLIIKEHPALVGAVDYQRVRDLLTNYEHLMILNPSINNFDVMRSADAVITVNSKSGAEAILLGKPVVVLGDAFYRTSKLVHVTERLGQLPEILQRAIENKPDHRACRDIYPYFQQIWNHSWPGELYLAEQQNIQIFSQSLDDYLNLSNDSGI